MNRGRGIVLAACLVLTLLTPAFGEDDLLDNLFDQDDTVVSGGGSSKPVGIVRPIFLYFGNVETQGVFANGWRDEGRTEAASNIWYFLHLQGGLDVMPIPQARLIGTFSTYLPQGLDSSIINNLRTGNSQTGVVTITPESINTSASLALDDLYLDYSILDSAAFRIGKFSETWGQGRLFNPGNLASPTSGGVNLRGFGAWGPFTLTGLVVGNPGYFAELSKPRSDELGYAGSLGFSWGFFTGGVSGFTQAKAGETLDFYLRSSLLGFDLYGEYLRYHKPGEDWWPGLFLGTFREINLFGWKWKAVGEYWLDGSSHDMARANVGIGATSDPVFSGWDLRFSGRWMHSLGDGSGQLVAGLVITPLPKLDIGLGVPWTYGSSTGQYVKGNSDPEKRLLAGVLNVSVSFDFEKEW